MSFTEPGGARSMSFTGWNDWDERGMLKPGVEGHCRSAEFR